uniref:Uncharacterized protein n=1 Tax=Heterosigma akashiwo TaxID=2829 RepID=A0A7S4D7S7_HETAK
MGLVELFSKLKFVMKSEERRETLLALLKVINNIVMYQYQGNHALVYELIHRKETTFIKLAALSPDILDFKALLASSDQEEEGAGRRSEDLLAKQLQSRLALLEQAAAPQGKADTDTENWEQAGRETPFPPRASPAVVPPLFLWKSGAPCPLAFFWKPLVASSLSKE